MRVAAFGYGKLYNYFLANKIKDAFANQMDVICIIDNNRLLWGQSVGEVHIISADDLVGRIHKEHLEAIVITAGYMTANHMLRQLQALEIKLPIYVVDERRINKDSFLWEADMQKPSIGYIECDVVAHCNLKCTGCGHLSNIMDEAYLEPDVFKRDFNRLSELYAGIDVIRLLGGEPLLHPRLPEFIHIASDCFPHSEIHVVTNGLLLPKMPKSLFDAMDGCGAVFDISHYRPTFEKWFAIKQTLQQYQVRYNLSEPINYFMKGIDIKPIDYREVFRGCVLKCPSIENGFMKVCGIGVRCNQLNEYFGVNVWDISDVKTFSGLVNIHEKGLDGWELNRKLALPFPACGFCRRGNFIQDMVTDEKLRMKWTCGREAKITDWIYGAGADAQ